MRFCGEQLHAVRDGRLELVDCGRAAVFQVPAFEEFGPDEYLCLPCARQTRIERRRADVWPIDSNTTVEGLPADEWLDIYLGQY